ncbi:YchF/TatD family DNA exonuclease [Candidatus Poribacteria bacterium]|nr:YchF/TatD family DNA exonuclease [Candidatus Poribacteria bacterium]
MLVDTHAHLQMKDYKKDLDEVIKRASSYGVDNIINASFDLPSSRKAIELTEKYDNIFASVGIHPHDAKMLNDEALAELRRMAENPKVVAIGETGLDYYRDLSPRPVQKKAFEKHIQMALEMDMPIIIHNRDAHKDTLEMLDTYSDSLKGVMHCFSGDVDFADKCIKLGLYVSFAGPVTYPKSDELRRVAAFVPEDSFFLETDCPFLAPQFRRGKRNEPAYVKSIAQKVAEVRRMSFEEVAKIATQNAESLFGVGYAGS